MKKTISVFFAIYMTFGCSKEENNVTTTIEKLTITAVTPQTATLNTETTFTVTGTNLTENMDFWMANLNNITEVTGGTSSTRYFKGTPSDSTGSKEGVVKDDYGNTLYDFQVTFEAQICLLYTSPSPRD